MKSLLIKSENCELSKSSYGAISLDGERISDIILKNLPADLEDYRNYPVRIQISIDFLGQEGINTETVGYELAKEVLEEETKEEVETEEF